MAKEKSYEYAKFAKIHPDVGRYTNLGFQAYVTLPSSKSLPQGGSYINTYCGMAGFECGISVKYRSDFMDSRTGTYQWHWFANGPEGQIDGPMCEYRDGEKVHIKLVRLENDHVQFIVDGDEKFTSKHAYGENTFKTDDTCARFIIGSEITRYPTLPSSLPQWNLSFSRLQISDMRYKKASGAWKDVNSANATARLSHTPVELTPPSPVNFNGVDDDLENGRFAVSMRV
ncbi:hypothetical protein G7L40_27015 (plasmid) [Paenibacillus polymyxa]|uniref:Uncharacterized protein n=1 Tax=Paenibacillus polymyxa TaxID=1406 RepID=A0A379LTF3_PAEPO|nr:hypothetical protein [Paenibacillus polymyxa]MBE7901114.1 hypothetical protein [Paenibacillus polymyxa]MBG9764563.1 hypothetical protein [Paenibacillus polymyxa]MCC3261697.1 hypothetical protein [Paenibacillus polymyxa]QPK56327.1 hypothetical protein G7035_27095 [Paenibacillus polymyxa]QPK61344.1 hypothetical protein G7L40_27015 [Paenibacillus polymyxa]